jgi:membrane protein DedA with SNARE-associated domain
VGAIVDLVGQVMSSPWIYPVLVLLAAVDGFLPLVPSETVVITAGVFAATGEPNVILVVAAAALGAYAGDHVSYFAGRFARDRWRRRGGAGRVRDALSRAGRPGGRTSRRRATAEWARRMLARRGGLILVVARYIPGGRTAVTLTTGAVGYPLRLFTSFDAIGAVSWGIYCTMIGYLGGKAFEQDPLRGLLLGFGVALTITVVTEVVHQYGRRRSARRAAGRQDRAGVPRPTGRPR